MGSGFVGVLRDHAKDVLRLEKDQAAAFLGHLESMKVVLVGRLSAMADADEKFNAFRLRSVLAETETAIKALQRKAMGQFSTMDDLATELSLQHVGSDLEKLHLQFEGRHIGISLNPSKIIADPGHKLLATQFESSINRYGEGLLNNVRRQIFIGFRTGDSFGNVVKAIAAPAGPFGGVTKDEAKRIARTETAQVYGEVQHQGIAQAKKKIPTLQKTWVHVGSYPCPICMPLHGSTIDMDKTWEVSGRNSSYEVLHPPAHPNCVCRIVAMTPEWKSELEALGYLDQEQAGSAPQDL